MKKRFSYQRFVILSVLKSTTSHPSAEILYHMVREILPKISLGTVYRNLNELAECGEILKLATPLAANCFDGNPKPHSHLVCEKCSKVEDAFIAWPKLSIEVSKHTNALIVSNEVVFTVVCEQCRSLYEGKKVSKRK